MDKHVLALVSLVGSCFDVLGALYLAYDLLGGEHGPLRTLTRMVTYGVMAGMGYGVALGPVFGLTSGASHGLTLAWEFTREARHETKPGFWLDAAMSAIRGLGFAVGASFLFGAAFGITFGVLSTAGQIIGYSRGMRPTLDYAPDTRPRLTRRQAIGSVIRTIGYVLTGYVSALVGHQRAHALTLGLKAGLLIGLVTTISIACTPFIEWSADNFPAKRMGVLGIGLILTGFSLQSVQYWLALLDLSPK